MARDKRKEGAAEPVKALSGLYPARSLVDEREAHSVDLPASAASYFVWAGSGRPSAFMAMDGASLPGK